MLCLTFKTPTPCLCAAPSSHGQHTCWGVCAHAALCFPLVVNVCTLCGVERKTLLCFAQKFPRLGSLTFGCHCNTLITWEKVGLSQSAGPFSPEQSHLGTHISLPFSFFVASGDSCSSWEVWKPMCGLPPPASCECSQTAGPCCGCWLCLLCSFLLYKRYLWITRDGGHCSHSLPERHPPVSLSLHFKEVEFWFCICFLASTEGIV